MAITEQTFTSGVDDGDQLETTNFNVSHAVGQNAANWWTDIMLVQYFIRNIYQVNGRDGAVNIWQMTEVSREGLTDLPDPHTDYKALAKTAKWIKNFQIDAILMNSFSLHADGRVDPGVGGGLLSTGDLYTIYVMNQTYQNSLANIGIDDWYGWAMGDPGLPQSVKAQLY